MKQATSHSGVAGVVIPQVPACLMLAVHLEGYVHLQQQSAPGSCYMETVFVATDRVQGD